MGDNMNCKSELKEILKDYLRGTLSETESDSVRKHLEQCSECASEVEFIRILYPAMVHTHSQHILPDSLVEYQLGAKTGLSQNEFAGWKRELIERHLAICNDCQSELEKLEALDEELTSLEEPLRQTSPTTKPSGQKFILKLPNIFSFPKLRYVVAAAAIVLLVLIMRNQLFPPKVPRELTKKEVSTPSTPILAWVEVDQYPSSTFEQEIKIRGGKTAPVLSSAQNPQEAAIQEFQRHIKLVEGQVHFISPDKVEKSAEPQHQVWLQIVDSTGKILKDFSSRIPIKDQASRETLKPFQAWLIAFPSRVLYQIDITSDTARALWNIKKSKQVVVTFTFKEGNRYKATPALFIDLTDLGRIKKKLDIINGE